jgi:predicted ATPase
VWKERSPQRINLAPLSKNWSQRMIEHVVGKIPEESSRWIVDRAQGNPFYLEELLRVVRGGGKVGDDSNLPDTVLGTVQARFDIFGPDAKLVLRAGSIFGQTFRPAGVKALVDEDRRMDVDRWLEILTQREILFSRPTADLREYAFRHALLRQAAYEMLPPSEKRLGHLLAGKYLEQAGERQGIVLADHFERAGENPRAIHWLGVAAQQALDADDLVETLARVERAVNLGAAGEELCSMRSDRVAGEVLAWGICGGRASSQRSTCLRICSHQTGCPARALRRARPTSQVPRDCRAILRHRATSSS